MAVVNIKSRAITNRDATPKVRNPNTYEGGMVREFAGVVELTAADTSTSVYRFGQIPSNARLSSLRVFSDDCGSNTVGNFGLYQTTENGGAVVDEDLFASSVSLKDGALNGTDVTHEAAQTGTSDIDSLDKKIWEVLGLSADSHLMYDVCLTLTVTCDVGGTVGVKGQYVL